MAYKNVRDQEAFNVHLEHAKASLFLLSDYLRFRQEEDYDQMFNCLENIVNFNSAKIDLVEIDKQLLWLERNKDRWCVKDRETGNVIKVNTENKHAITQAFRKTFRTIVTELHKKGITHKHSDDPAHAMRHFES